MKRFVWLLLAFFIVGTGFAQSVDSAFAIKPVYGKQAKMIVNILESSHFRKLSFNDSLSSVVLDNFISNLDNSKTYFLKSDIDSFEKYRYQIDDLTRMEQVEPAFEIYKVFLKRFNERMDYVTKHLVNKEFDYTKDEFYETNRDKAPWVASKQELDKLWESIIKSQALSLKLTGKPQPEITDALQKRYERFIKSMSQTNGEDIVGIYLNTIAESYDPHTNYFSAKSADVFKQNMSQSFEGIGARLQADNDYTRIAEILPGGPAEKSKLLHVNDRIVGVAQGEDGEMVDVIGWRLDEVVKLIKGPKGTRVRLQVLPAETGVMGPSVIITLVRDKIKLEDLTAKRDLIQYTKDGKNLKLGVITLPSFYMDWEAYQKGDPNYNSTSNDVKKHILALQKEGIDGLVIDLRNNGGGSLKEAIDLTGLFIKNGPVVQVKSSGRRTDVYNDEDPSVIYNGPLTVLINRFSASASEIFAGAIQDYNRGLVVGESTYGKGTVQTMIELDRFIQDKDNPSGALKLTVQKFYRVTGSSTQQRGITPDIKLPSALDAEQFGESSNPNALPWDEIRGTLYQKTPLINDKVISTISRSYQDRLKNDAILNDFIVQTEEARKNINDTKISLNEATRRKQMEEAEKKVAARKPGNVTLNKEGKPVDGTLTLDDEYLREGLLILADLITSKIG